MDMKSFYFSLAGGQMHGLGKTLEMMGTAANDRTEKIVGTVLDVGGTALSALGAGRVTDFKTGLREVADEIYAYLNVPVAGDNPTPTATQPTATPAAPQPLNAPAPVRVEQSAAPAESTGSAEQSGATATLPADQNPG